MEKLTYCIWAALLTVVLACHENRQYDEQLQRADSLMEQSGSDIVAAAEGLNAIHADYHRMNHRQQMRYRLLQVKARNKLDQSVAGDTVMRDVADYYRRHGTPNERVEALYLLARVYHDQGLLPQAIEIYQMADQAADTTRSDCNWKHLFLVHSQLSQIYSEQRLPDSNLRELDIMRLYASKAKDTLNVILCDAWKSGVLWDKGLYDQAVDAENLINQKLIRKGYQTYANGNHILAIYRLLEKKHPKEARRLMDLQEHHGGIFDRNGNIEPGREIYYYSMGWYQLQANHIDSAKHLFYKLLSFSSNMNCAEAGYRGLFMLYQKLGQVDSVIKYAQLYCNANDSALKKLSTEKVEFIRSQYEYTKYQRLAEEKRHEARTTLHITSIIVLLFVVFYFILLHTFYKYKKKHQRKNELQNERYAEAYRRYASLSREYAEMASAVSVSKESYLQLTSEKDDLANEIKRLNAIIMNHKQDEQRSDRWSIEDQLLTCSEVVSLHQYAVKGTAPDSLWSDFMVKCQLYLPNFMSAINREDVALTDIEKQITILTKLRFLGTEIQNLLGKSSQSISNSRSNINKKLFGRKGVQGLDGSIHELGEDFSP